MEARGGRVKHEPPDDRIALLQGAVALVMSLVTGGIGFFLLFMLRDLVVTLLRHSEISHWAWTAIDNFALIIFVILWLSGVLLAQHYYSQGLRKRVAGRRFLFVTGILLVLCFLVVAIPGFLGLGDFAGHIWVLIATMGVIGLALIILGRRPWARNRKSGS